MDRVFKVICNEEEIHLSIDDIVSARNNPKLTILVETKTRGKYHPYKFSEFAKLPDVKKIVPDC